VREGGFDVVSREERVEEKASEVLEESSLTCALGLRIP
jgi:hypothetical protein